LNDGYHQLRVFFKKFTWSVRDKVAYEELLQHLVGFNDTLENILPGPLQLFLETALSATVCAAGVSNASDLPEIEKVSMQHAFLTSQLKWTSSVNNLGLVSRGSKLEEKDLERLSQDHKDKYRYLVKTRQGESNECFLVDWSQWEQTLDERLERIREISGLLSGGRCNDLRFLACMGYLEDQDYKAEKSRYALVYKFVGHRRRVKSLLQLLETFRTVQLPPLETRLTIARSLCRAVMLYHSSNWIHHDFRSHNIIFAGRTAITDDTFKFNGVEYQGLEVEEPYIVGFSHARNEADVSLMFKNRELTSKTLKEQSLYWSPDYLSSRGDKRTKQSFQRTHDIYALGCVLLELGVWKPLDSYWKSTYDNDHEKWYRRLLAEEGKLRAMCGSRYAETIIHCLNWGTSDIETDVQSLAFDILLRLEEIVV
jgi:serine/threonine protein kinase